jgi:hypothetical protein
MRPILVNEEICMTFVRATMLLAALSLSAHASVPFSGQVFFHPTSGADTITFSHIVLGSPLLITRLDLTIGNGVNNTVASRSLFFDLPGGAVGFGTANDYTAAGNGLITGIQTVDTPGDGLADRTLGVTFTSWVAGGVFTISLDVDRLSNSFSQGAGGTNCNNCDNINGNDFLDGGAITFRMWLASADAGKIIVQPNYIDIPANQWAKASSNDAIATWSTELDVEDAILEPVPEPSSWTLLTVGLGALAAAAHRRTTKNRRKKHVRRRL